MQKVVSFLICDFLLRKPKWFDLILNGFNLDGKIHKPLRTIVPSNHSTRLFKTNDDWSFSELPISISFPNKEQKKLI